MPRSTPTGATDFLTKTIDSQELRVRARNLLSLRQAQSALADRAVHLAMEVEKATRKLATRRERVIWRLAARASNCGRQYDGDHVSRVATVARLIAEQLGMDKVYCDTLFLARRCMTRLKIGIPDAILNKPGRLTSEELSVMRSHTAIGPGILAEGGRDRALMRLAEEIARTHLMKNGTAPATVQPVRSGIPLSGRIVAVADVFDALCTERPYKAAWSSLTRPAPKSVASRVSISTPAASPHSRQVARNRPNLQRPSHVSATVKTLKPPSNRPGARKCSFVFFPLLHLLPSCPSRRWPADLAQPWAR